MYTHNGSAAYHSVSDIYVPRIALRCPSSVCRMTWQMWLTDLPRNCSHAVSSSSFSVITWQRVIVEECMYMSKGMSHIICKIYIKIKGGRSCMPTNVISKDCFTSDYHTFARVLRQISLRESSDIKLRAANVC